MSDEKSGGVKSDNVKVVLRHLPRFMTEKEVLEQISPLPEEVLGTYFTPANLAFDRSAHATLTLLFSEYCDSLLDFERRFDGYIFVDSRGNDSSAVVEAAVNQNFSKCDRVRIKEDSRVGAIVTDKYYLEFCKKLEEERNIPIMTLEQQIRKLNKPEDARTQLDHLETPLVKHFFDKAAGRRRDQEVRRQRREIRHADKKAAVEIAQPSPAPSTAPSQVSRKKDFSKMTPEEREKMEKRKERDAIRKKKFLEDKKKLLDEKKKMKEERDADNRNQPGPAPREKKKKERFTKPPRPSPAKTLSEQQGEDWIKKLTDPKATIKSKHELPGRSNLNEGGRPKTAPSRSTPNTSSTLPKRPQTAPK